VAKRLCYCLQCQLARCVGCVPGLILVFEGSQRDPRAGGVVGNWRAACGRRSRFKEPITWLAPENETRQRGITIAFLGGSARHRCGTGLSRGQTAVVQCSSSLRMLRRRRGHLFLVVLAALSGAVGAAQAIDFRSSDAQRSGRAAGRLGPARGSIGAAPCRSWSPPRGAVFSSCQFLRIQPPWIHFWALSGSRSPTSLL